MCDSRRLLRSSCCTNSVPLQVSGLIAVKGPSNRPDLGGAGNAGTVNISKKQQGLDRVDPPLEWTRLPPGEPGDFLKMFKEVTSTKKCLEVFKDQWWVFCTSCKPARAFWKDCFDSHNHSEHNGAAKSEPPQPQLSLRASLACGEAVCKALVDNKSFSSSLTPRYQIARPLVKQIASSVHLYTMQGQVSKPALIVDVMTACMVMFQSHFT